MTLKVCEIFQSIQGESTWTGLPCTFIRLAGCNLDCTWCDTRYAKDETNAKIMDTDLIMQSVKTAELNYVCVTGGEPLTQSGTIGLLKKLLQEGYRVSLETNGSINWTHLPETISCIVDIKCPSSGMSAHNRLDCLAGLRLNDQIKFVVSDHQDYVFAREIYHRYLKNFDGPMFVSPVYGVMNPLMLANWLISDKIPMRLHLQMHKILKLK